MNGQVLTPDQIVYVRWGIVELNATIVFTWAVMAVLVGAAIIGTRRLSTGAQVSRWQIMLESVVGFIRNEIRRVTRGNPDPYVPFIGTLFLFILTGAALEVVPGFQNPFASLSTTAALAICVFVAVPLFGILEQGLGGYLRHYVEPSPFMLPFHIIGELSRTLALAVRLFGNMMSGSKIVGILVSLVGFIFPMVMQVLGLLIGAIQAYIFAILAMVYISSGMEAHLDESERTSSEDDAETDAGRGRDPQSPAADTTAKGQKNE